MGNEQCKFIAIYSRKSKFTGKGESIENQIELCKQYINTHFTEAITNIFVYEDEGFSGGSTQRPQFKKMMSDARDKKISAIVCYRLDRISRNIGDFAKLMEELDSLGISFVSIKEQFDTNSPMGRAMMYISSVFSQLERETIAERIRDNMRELSKTGRWLGGTTPIGYYSESVENITMDGRIKRSYKLKKIIEEAELVRQIFHIYLETDSLTKTEACMYRNRYSTKRGNAFSRFAIKNILTNPVYMIADKDAYEYLTVNEADLYSDETEFDGKCGIMAYNRTIQKAGFAHQIRPMNEWIVAVGKHDGIINGIDWVRVQERMNCNKSKTHGKTKSNVALLSGLLICGNCGEHMRPKLTSRLNKQGERAYFYICGKKERSRRLSCNMSNVNGNMLDKAVCAEMSMLDENKQELIRLIDTGKQAVLNKHDGRGANLSQLRRSIDDNEKEISSLVSLLAQKNGGVSDNYITKQIERLHDDNKIIAQRISELELEVSGQAMSDFEYNNALNMLLSFENVLINMNIEQKREVLRLLVGKTIWDGENAHIYL